MVIPFFPLIFQTQKTKKTSITLKCEKEHQLALKHTKIIQKRISTITLELGSQPSLNNHQFNFDNNSISVSSFKIPRTKDEQSPIIYKDIRQVQQQLNYTNNSLQHLNQQTIKISQLLFSSALEGRQKKHQNQLFLQTFSQLYHHHHLILLSLQMNLSLFL